MEGNAAAAVRRATLVVAYCGRGAVVWRDGHIRFAGGRTLRALGRTDEALAAQLDLVQWMAAAELTDSYIEEEIGECLTALGRAAEAAAHFALAAGLLEAAGPGEDPDAERLAHLRGLATQSRTTPEPEID